MLKSQFTDGSHPGVVPQAAIAMLSGRPSGLPVNGRVSRMVCTKVSIFLKKIAPDSSDSGAKYHSSERSYESAVNGSSSGLPAVTVRVLPDTLTADPGLNWARDGRVITLAAPKRMSSD